VLNDALFRFPATAIRDEMGPREDRNSAVLRQVLVGERTTAITRHARVRQPLEKRPIACSGAWLGSVILRSNFSHHGVGNSMPKAETISPTSMKKIIAAASRRKY
jgi:hypothetical protein